MSKEMRKLINQTKNFGKSLNESGGHANMGSSIAFDGYKKPERVKKEGEVEIYKNWRIRKCDYAGGYYEATNLNDCDAFMKHAKSIEQIKIEIDEEE